jgi:chromosome segregation ATPase
VKTFNGSSLKNKQTLVAKLKLEREKMVQELKELQRSVAHKEAQIKKHEEELLKMQEGAKNLIVSEHALLRYLERVYKLDLSKLESEIVPEELQRQVSEYGNGTYKLENFSIKVVENVIVTVMD